MSLKYIQIQGWVEIECLESIVQELEQVPSRICFHYAKGGGILTKRRASVLLGTVLHILAILQSLF